MHGAELSGPRRRTRVGALKHTMVSGVPFPNCRGGVIGLAIPDDPDGHPSRWQEAARHEIIPDTHKNGAGTWQRLAARPGSS